MMLGIMGLFKGVMLIVVVLIVSVLVVYDWFGGLGSWLLVVLLYYIVGLVVLVCSVIVGLVFVELNVFVGFDVIELFNVIKRLGFGW